MVAALTDRHATLYEAAAGVRRIGDSDAMQVDDVFALFSTTKSITATAALQLHERGQLDLDAPAATYAPDIADLEVIDGFDDDGAPVLRAPKSDVTTRHLLTHTGGFGYDFFDPTYARLAAEHDQPTTVTAMKGALMTPLLFDPGERWQYGTGVDWVGQVVEGITGARLGEVLAREIFGPLGMDSMTFALDDARRARLAQVHGRTEDGSLAPMGLELPSPPEVDMGGHGLYGTVGDYLKFIRMWLSDGRGPGGPVLRPDTVASALARQLPEHLSVTALHTANPPLSHDFEMFPGSPKSWSLAFMRNEELTTTGRPAGSQGWAGLANLFFWIDHENGLGGFWATQVFPFADPISMNAYLAYERACYDAVVD